MFLLCGLLERREEVVGRSGNEKRGIGGEEDVVVVTIAVRRGGSSGCSRCCTRVKGGTQEPCIGGVGDGT